MKSLINKTICLLICIITGLSALAQSVKDIDGNKYKTIRIGTSQVMAENLRVKHYQNGSGIIFAPEQNVWRTMGETGIGAYCYFNNDSTTAQKTGLIYNYHVASDKRNVCPAGWRVPSKDDWASLLDSILIKHPEFIPKSAVRAAWGTRFNNWSDRGSLWSSTINPSDTNRAYALDFSYDKYLLTPFTGAGDGIRCISGDAGLNITRTPSSSIAQNTLNATSGISAGISNAKPVDPIKKMLFEKHVTATFPDTIAEKYSENNSMFNATSYKSRYNGAEYVIKTYEFTDKAVIAVQSAGKNPHKMIIDNEVNINSAVVSDIKSFYENPLVNGNSYTLTTSGAIIKVRQVTFNENDGCLIMVASKKDTDPGPLLEKFFKKVSFKR